MAESRGNLQFKHNDILIVDDQLTNLKVLASMLKEQKYKVRKATNGKSAIEAVKLNPPHLILLDILMPDMDGYQVCEALKSDPETEDIPIIFISALSDVFDKVKAFELGASDYITKPFQEEEVLARIKSQLIIRSQKKLLEEQQKLLTYEKYTLKQEIKKRIEAEAILYQSRALISSILTNSLDGIAALEAVRDPRTGQIKDFRCLVTNPPIAEIFNRSPEDLIGKLVFRRFIQRIDPKLFKFFVKVVQTGISFENEFSYEHQQESKWYNYIAVKLADGFAITVRDVTQRKNVELELQRLATIDGLTRIANRRTFDQIIVREWKRCQREQQPLSLILCDIDYFKRYNDCYQHQQGDECLAKVAKTISEQVKRSSDLVARYGGEEFAIILPNTNKEGAIILAEMIQRAIREQAIPHKDSQVSDIVSLSLGIACTIPRAEISLEESICPADQILCNTCVIPRSLTSPAELISLADQALYQAKQEGRNRYVII